MSYAQLQLFSVKDWTPAHAAEVAYTTAAVLEQPAQPATVATNAYYRVARIQAHDGVLLIRRVLAKDVGGGAPALSSGDVRVASGGVEYLQLQNGDAVAVQALAGTVHGAAIFGR